MRVDLPHENALGTDRHRPDPLPDHRLRQRRTPPQQAQDQATTPPVEIRSAPRTPDDPPVRYSRIDVGRFPGDVGGSLLVKRPPVVTLVDGWPTSAIAAGEGFRIRSRSDGRSPRYLLVGRSEDGAWIALRRVNGDDELIWLKSDGVASADIVAELAVQPGAPRAGPEPVMASHDWFSIGIRAWPGHENGFRIVQRWGQPPTEYPVVGRSLNGRYVAIRLGTANPPVVWVERGSVGLDADLTDAPVLVASGTEAIGANGEFTAVQRMSRWQWRDDNTIVGTNQSGVWHWDPAANILRKMTADSFKPVFSPDGAYAAVGIGRQREDGMIDWQGERTVRIWSLDHDGPPQVFEHVNRFGFTHHPHRPLAALVTRLALPALVSARPRLKTAGSLVRARPRWRTIRVAPGRAGRARLVGRFDARLPGCGRD